MASVLDWEFIDAELPKGALGPKRCAIAACEGRVRARGLLFTHSIEGAA
ncbi:hypothetical protein K8O93_01245 [Gordonia bronchialis]|nr:hypothetical protein [Gordonia bronchialis]UAK38460.1 hypothetical protein K8O93_01245 [Gordonia bronchialis]